MKRKKKSLLSLLALGTFLSMAQGVSVVSAQTEVAMLPIEKIDRVDMVNVRELGQKAYKYSYMTDQEGNYRTAVVSGNGRVVEFKEQSPFVMVDGERTPLSTTTIKGGAILPTWNDGVKFDGMDVYVPKEAVLDIFELLERADGLVYEKEIIEVVEQPVIEDEIEFIKPVEQEKPKKELEKPKEEPEEEATQKDEDETPVEEEKTEETESREDVIQEELTEVDKEVETPNVDPVEEEELPDEKKEPAITDLNWSTFLKEIKQKVEPLQVKEYSDGSIAVDIDNQKPESADLKLHILAWLDEQLYVYEVREVTTTTQISVKRSLR